MASTLRKWRRAYKKSAKKGIIEGRKLIERRRSAYNKSVEKGIAEGRKMIKRKKK
ncbi:MAG: hypothetical protein KGY70_19680 [Bacteroidales bacterium]|nr:hypothetical protein [Bacteroidales bacterium]